jgi:hypothetical protein
MDKDKESAKPGAKKFEERDWDDISAIRRAPAKAAVAGEEERPVKKSAKPETADGPAALLEEMKAQGIDGAIVRNDGFLIHSTLAITDAGAGFLSSVANVADAMMKRSADAPREIEVSFGTLILVLIPVGNHIFCGAVKSRDQKKAVREFAERAKVLL